MNKKIANEILKVVTNYSDFNLVDYGEWGNEIIQEVNNWINENDVNDVEFTVSKEELEDVWGNSDSIKEVTDRKINFVKDYCSLQEKMKKVLEKDYNGPGWDKVKRSDNRWNDSYFFTGSDCTHYVLVHKIT